MNVLGVSKTINFVRIGPMKGAFKKVSFFSLCGKLLSFELSMDLIRCCNYLRR